MHGNLPCEQVGNNCHQYQALFFVSFLIIFFQICFGDVTTFGNNFVFSDDDTHNYSFIGSYYFSVVVVNLVLLLPATLAVLIWLP
mmetsp:Transcript_36569/g.40837  ORF Transcript_36569/g.40837 Transcript_36569/m.40837 type:complete len:85 (-) Transcript_36569:1847-2101(-)